MKQFFFWLLVFLFFGGRVLGQNADPFSPTVTPAESEQIRLARTLGEQDPVKAVAQLRGEIKASASAALDFTLGNLLFQNEQYAEAASAYETALKKFPAFRDAKINLGRVYLLLERPEASVRVYQELVRDGIADAETYVLLGHGLMMGTRPVSAETAYRQALLLDENGREARHGLLNALMAQQRDAEVLALTGELLKAEPGRRPYWAARANAQLSLGKPGDAAQSLEQARRLGVADAEMLSMLGQLYLQEGIPEEAVARFEEAFSGGELSLLRREQAVRGLMQLDRLTDAERLLAVLGAQLKSLPDAERVPAEGTVLKLNCRLKVRQGRTEEAGDLIRKGLEKNPLDGELLQLQAGVLREQDREEEAVLVLQRLSRIQGFEAEALLQLAQIEVDRKNWAAAVKLLERAQVFEEKPEWDDYLQQLRKMADGR